MKNPQTTNGFISIANELWEALAKHRISGEEWQILNVIIRKTYGYKKKEDYIPYESFITMTGLKKQNVYRSLKKLINRKIVIKSDYNKLSVNKNYDEWDQSSKLITPVIKNDYSVIKNDYQKSSKLITPYIKENKEIISKEIITNVITEFGNSEINEVSKYFLEKMNLPKEDLPVYKSRRYWNTLLKESGRGVAGVKMLIDLACEDTYYRNNITSSMDLYYKRIKLMARKRADKPIIAVMPTAERNAYEPVDTHGGDRQVYAN